MRLRDAVKLMSSRVVTTPLLLLDLLLTAGLPWPTILYTLLIDEIMIITGLIGALVTSSYKVDFSTSQNPLVQEADAS